MSIFDCVKKVIIEQLGVSEDEITLEAKFVDDLKADSLDVVEMVITLEVQLSIEIPDADVYNFKTVGDVVSYIEAIKK